MSLRIHVSMPVRLPKPVQLSFYPNDHQTDLKEQELQFKGVDDCHGWINDNWQDTGLDDGSGWMSIQRLLDDGGELKTVRFAFEALGNEPDRNTDHFRFTSKVKEDNDAWSYMSFGMAPAVGEYKRGQLRDLVQRLLLDDLTPDDLYALFELELKR